MTHVYLDVETTGRDPDRHEIWELAYAVDDGPIHVGRTLHSFRHADPDALNMNGYWTRQGGDSRETFEFNIEVNARAALNGATLVAANPAFDAAFLRARWGATPWKYRLLDVEAYAMGALGHDEPQGLSTICAALGVEQPDHSARGDVRALRECHVRLKAMYWRP